MFKFSSTDHWWPSLERWLLAQLCNLQSVRICFGKNNCFCNLSKNLKEFEIGTGQPHLPLSYVFFLSCVVRKANILLSRSSKGFVTYFFPTKDTSICMRLPSQFIAILRVFLGTTSECSTWYLFHNQNRITDLRTNWFQ